MGDNYYNILQVNRNASEENVEIAFKRLVMKWHPDNNPSNKEEARAMFKQISQAYDVLSNPQKRQFYDLHGQVPPPPSSPASPSNPNSSFRFDPSSPEEIFSEFFTGSNSTGGRGPVFREKKNSDGDVGNQSNPKGPTTENKLQCSLEELYFGTTKRMKISRTIVDAFGNSRSEEEILDINIKAGWKKGTKITFAEKGDRVAGIIPGDIVFVIEEKPREVYKRDGNDLVINQKISLLEALIGKTLNLITLDGRDLRIPVTNIVTPGYEMVIQGEGMPIREKQGTKGNLRIKFYVKFPSRLTAEQKSTLSRALGS